MAPAAAPAPFEAPLRYRDPLAGLASKLGWRWVLLLTLLIYGVGEKIILPVIGGYFRLSGDIRTWRPDVEALVSGFILVPTILVAYVWQTSGVWNIFAGFARAESFSDKPAFEEFLANARTWFARQRWWPVALGVAVVGVLIQGLWFWDKTNPKPVPPWWTEGEPLARIVALALAPLLWYAAAQIVIGEVRLAWTLRRLWQRLGGSLVLRGRQQSAGVATLSRHIGILATIGAVVLLNLVLGALLPQIRASDASPDYKSWLIVIWAAYLVVVPGITLTLILPAHRVMTRAKDERLRAVTTEINNELTRIEPATADARTLTASLERIEALRKLRAMLDAELPRWPLPNPVRTVSWSASVPILLSILTTALDQFG